MPSDRHGGAEKRKARQREPLGLLEVRNAYAPGTVGRIQHHEGNVVTITRVIRPFTSAGLSATAQWPPQANPGSRCLALTSELQSSILPTEQRLR